MKLTRLCPTFISTIEGKYLRTAMPAIDSIHHVKNVNHVQDEVNAVVYRGWLDSCSRMERDTIIGQERFFL